ncbi:4-alpha-glucanotransferase [Elioraea rosea]|uniref:4-alpha-glucanotransferase n=1 Tax=Elioraea rosea TaxID=2492390 RepID=UPI001183DE33|nr:4-alpha-glucanotransferase [Elioraea rosea]
MTGTDEALLALARLNGIDPSWTDYRGEHRHVGIDTIRALLRAVGVDETRPEERLREAESGLWHGALPPLLTGIAGGALTVPLGEQDLGQAVTWRLEDAAGGLHHGTAEPFRGDAGAMRFTITLPEAIGEATLDFSERSVRVLVAPPSCHRGALATRRLWGIGAQVYGLRGAGDGGLGHLGHLPPLVRAAASAGADALAVSPLHALFAADPLAYSPYSPSHRSMLNGWMADPGGLADVASVAELAASLGLSDGLGELQASSLVDYGRAVPARLALLRALFARFREAHRGSALEAEFLAFRSSGGMTLENHARFEVLHAVQYQRDPSLWDWRSWDAPLRNPASEEVERFAAAQAEEVTFHAFLQWLAARQLDAAQKAAMDAGMGIGLISDLAVGNSPGGSRAWSGTAALLSGVAIGAPPDALNPIGQNWGLTTFAPRPLVEAAFLPFLEDLRTAMRHAGGIRLDHVMGLARIWCIPDGAAPGEGAYLRFPAADMLRIVAAESEADEAIVIGEDLGTVPEGYGETLADHVLYGIRVLFFEREGTGFAAPSRYDATATATSTTHDLPTLAGWWEGQDIPLREELGLLAPGETREQAEALRAEDRRCLWQALAEHGGAQGEPPLRAEHQLGTSVARFLGATPSPLVVMPLEDVTLTVEQPNLPGTTSEHPNWRRRVRKEAERLLGEEPAVSILAALDEARRRR